MRSNANPLHNPQRVYAKILNAGMDGITPTELCEQSGIDISKVDQVLASVDNNWYITCEDAGRIYALEVFYEPEPRWIRDSNYYRRIR